tara:strand:+ start:236 stop:589 length:354 start_codon:yes stop_codon:yes gene_type:complete
MQVIRSHEFTAERAWGALDIANMNGITTRLHWTNEPYKWHINNGEEVFVVLSGQVEMLYKQHGEVCAELLNPGGYLFCQCWHGACCASQGRSANFGYRIARQCITKKAPALLGPFVI